MVIVDRLTSTNDNTDTIFAAIDLGSNSFHMLLVREADGHLQVVDRMQDMVQLAAGLDEGRSLNSPAQAHALGCLARVGQRLRGLPAAQVRAADLESKVPYLKSWR